MASALTQGEDSCVTQEEFYQLGLEGNTVLRDYQLAGVNWIIDCYNNNHGCILGDEMGLGKTIQSISFLLFLKSKLSTFSFLVVCPLSTVQNWEKEFEAFAPEFNVITLVGDKETRESKLTQIKHSKSLDSVVITTAEYVLRELELSKLKWSCFVFDEAHRLKNPKSKLYTTIQTHYTLKFTLLLTGTPIQNNLLELYALLSFIHTESFPLSDIDKFLQEYQETDVNNSNDVKELYSLLKPYILRRIKKEVYSMSQIYSSPGQTALHIGTAQDRWSCSDLLRNLSLSDQTGPNPASFSDQ